MTVGADHRTAPPPEWSGTALDHLLERQQAFFASGATRPYAFRVQQLRTLREMLRQHEDRLYAALDADMRKPPMEAYGGEIGFVYAEISHALKHLKRWMKPRRVGSPLAAMPARSYIYSEPVGRVLIIGPWNYPVNLILAPLVAALAAGNVAVLKPSELAPNTSAVLADLIGRTFPPEVVAVVEGAVEASRLLLSRRWDHIFFTGGGGVGKIVAQAAAEHMTPVTLELGGKSPCIVHSDADLDLAARRIVWGKFFNAGQTCVAPDYVLAHTAVKEDLLGRMAEYLTRFYGPDPKASPDLARIVNERHFDRLTALLGHGARIVAGGQSDRAARYIAPTILTDVGLDHPSMAEEIFGPILPVLAYDTPDEAEAVIRQRPHPLALYVFSRSRQVQDRFIREVPFGGGCINDAVIHLSNPDLPFGGVGGSGMGAYHGKHGFDLFSHQKGLVHSLPLIDLPLRYPPYGNILRWVRLLLR